MRSRGTRPRRSLRGVLAAVETERLLLRPFAASDLDALAALDAIEAFWWFPLRRARTREETQAFLGRHIERSTSDDIDLWAAVEKATERLVGWAGLNYPDWFPEVMPAVEVGWRFDPAVWGRGLATEAGAASLRHGFDTLGLDTIVSICEPDNVSSWRVMERLGMHRARETVHTTSQLPLWVYEITAVEWLST